MKVVIGYYSSCVLKDNFPHLKRQRINTRGGTKYPSLHSTDQQALKDFPSYLVHCLLNYPLFLVVELTFVPKFSGICVLISYIFITFHLYSEN